MRIVRFTALAVLFTITCAADTIDHKITDPESILRLLNSNLIYKEWITLNQKMVNGRAGTITWKFRDSSTIRRIVRNELFPGPFSNIAESPLTIASPDKAHFISAYWIGSDDEGKESYSDYFDQGIEFFTRNDTDAVYRVSFFGTNGGCEEIAWLNERYCALMDFSETYDPVLQQSYRSQLDIGIFDSKSHVRYDFTGPVLKKGIALKMGRYPYVPRIIRKYIKKHKNVKFTFGNTVISPGK